MPHSFRKKFFAIKHATLEIFCGVASLVIDVVGSRYDIWFHVFPEFLILVFGHIEARLCVVVEPFGGASSGLIRMATPIRVETQFWILKGDRQLHITYHLINDHGITVLTTG